MTMIAKAQSPAAILNSLGALNCARTSYDVVSTSANKRSVVLFFIAATTGRG